MTDVKILESQNIKKGDTIPPLRAKLTRGGKPFNLNGYTVTLSMKLAEADSPTLDTVTVNIEAETRGLVSYDWADGDTDEHGTYEVEFVADDGTDKMTFPNSGYANIYIQRGL